MKKLRKLILMLGMVLMSYNTLAEDIVEPPSNEEIIPQNIREKARILYQGYIKIKDYVFLLKEYDTNFDSHMDFGEAYIPGETKPFIYGADLDHDGKIEENEIFIDIKRDGLNKNEERINSFLKRNNIQIVPMGKGYSIDFINQL